MKKSKIVDNRWTKYEYISKLSSRIENKLDVYSYKLARYLNRADVDLRNYDNDYDYFIDFSRTFSQDADLMPSPSTNVVKSCIDALVSKLSNNKVRPFFSPIDGTFKTKKVVRQAQQFFDVYYDQINLNHIVSTAFKDACIFDIGYIMVNPFNYTIQRVAPYNISVLETNGTDPKVALIKIKHIPNSELDSYGVTSDKQYVNIEILIDHEDVTLYVDEQPVKDVKVSAFPIVRVYYNEPIHLNKTVSIVDELDGIQTQIDLINSKISATSQLTPANIVFVDENSGLKASDVNNKDAQIYPIGIAPGNNANPISVVTPVPFDPMWQQMLDFYVNKAYDMIGISQLSAQSRKPSGLDSGVALQTMEDIESDRFETQVDHFINAYINVTKKVIEVIPEDEEILPSNKYQNSMKWSDLKEQSNLFKVQYSAATSLSKDPAERAKQIIQMSQIGLIVPSKAAELMDMPDLTDAYTDAEAMEMAVAAIIDNAVEHDIINIPEYVSWSSLAREICLVQNQLFVSLKEGKENIDSNREIVRSLNSLQKLADELDAKMVEEGLIDLTPDEVQEQTDMNEPLQSDSGLAQTQAADYLNATEDTL